MMSIAAPVVEAPPTFAGEWIVPDDPRYEELRWINDRRYDRRPAVIARPRGVADVQAAVRIARSSGLPLTVRSGGHGFTGFALADDAVMIDMRLMDDVHVDLVRRSVRIRPGALGGNIIRECAPYGLAPVTGMVGDIGYGGIGTMGGFGYLSPRHGATCDNVLSCEVVLADGSWVTASPVANPDLFWAIRGAGDNFGVVTAFELMLHPVPRETAVITLLWETDTALEPLKRFIELEPTLSEDLYWSVDAFFCEPGRVGMGISAFHLGRPEVRSRELETLRGLASLGNSLECEIRTVPYEEMYYLPLHGARWFDTTRVYYNVALLSNLRDDVWELFRSQAERLQEGAGDPATERRAIAMYPYDKGLSRPAVPPAAHVARQGWVYLPMSYYLDAEEDAGHERWSDAMAQEFVDAGHTFGVRNAGMLHAVSKLNKQAVKDTFGESYPRLLDLKAKFDPDNIFRGTLSVD
jgi:FAD/FMN-containing dehydrogenase